MERSLFTIEWRSLLATEERLGKKRVEGGEKAQNRMADERLG